MSSRDGVFLSNFTDDGWRISSMMPSASGCFGRFGGRSIIVENDSIRVGAEPRGLFASLKNLATAYPETNLPRAASSAANQPCKNLHFVPSLRLSDSRRSA